VLHHVLQGLRAVGRDGDGRPARVQSLLGAGRADHLRLDGPGAAVRLAQDQ
jgi:hypothetical protein